MSEGLWTEDDRRLLAALPKRVGIAVALSGGHNIIRFLQEMKTVEMADRIVGEFGPNPLIQHAIEQFRRPLPQARRTYSAELESEDSAPYKPDNLQREMTRDCERASALLEGYSKVSEAHAYRRWVVKVAETVAEIATEPEMLDAVRRKTPEWELVQAITQALGMQREAGDTI